MKHLKKFNEELEYSTYQSAAKKLRSKNHIVRARSLEDHSIDMNWRKMQDDFKDWGSSTISFKDRNSSSSSSFRSKNFYIGIDYMEDPSEESIIEAKEGDDTISLSFYMMVIPVDKDVIDYCSNKLPYNDISNGFYQGPFPVIRYGVVDGVLNFKGIYLLREENQWKLSRRTAVIFKKQLLACFEEGGHYNSRQTKYPTMHQRIRESLNRQDFTLEFDYTMEDIYNDIKNYPINDLYEE